MIICKYTKLGQAAYYPHLDVLRTVGMAIRRTGLSINFSDGFNPHARLFFSQPLPLGTQSECEYFCADSNEDAVDFMQRLNMSLPSGITVLKAKNTLLNPNAAAITAKADYKISFCKNLLKGIDISCIQNQNELIIEYIDKGIKKQKDVKEQVFKAENNDSTIFLTLASGNINLRAERLLNHILRQYFGANDEIGYTILKTAVYDRNDINLDKTFFD